MRFYVALNYHMLYALIENIGCYDIMRYRQFCQNNKGITRENKIKSYLGSSAMCT